MNIQFTVYGKPEPQGSMKAFMRKGARFPVVTSDNKNLKSYRQNLSVVALAQCRAEGFNPIPKKTPVEIELTFYFSRPASRSKRAAFTVKPDLDKLMRAVGDALTGICFEDDSQIVYAIIRKRYGSPERTIIEVREQ